MSPPNFQSWENFELHEEWGMLEEEREDTEEYSEEWYDIDNEMELIHQILINRNDW